ncbi:methyltransferase domain-containing protein [Dyella solisilvae]|uniref:Methyltransferase domain-containing protein n=1 Tax=Dyella solisilvae TaxID=1920168 RepID=A0A370KA39_9GAMM|nr:methyltransferase domain-containing protein [Dyella solisilvae]RDI99514.1 methyltransferase domain-containing protein [Dyella solisilvae]
MDRDQIYAKLQASAQSRETLFATLRSLPIDVVGDALHYVPPEYPEVRAHLPAMASSDVQEAWTGSSGYPLLMQSCAFVRNLESNFFRYTGRSIDDTRILDYGCGWGRLIRLMYKFTAPDKIYGCDPWDKSIALCKEAALLGTIEQSEYLPTALPFPEVKFDLIYAFSVFTHLSEQAAHAAMSACRRYIAHDGLMAITVRPRSYWDFHNEVRPRKVDAAELQQRHQMAGYAFSSDGKISIDGQPVYGDASISLEYMERMWPQWSVVGTDAMLQDGFQTIVYLRPA